MNNEWHELVEGLKSYYIPALARLITQVENREPGWMDAMKQIFPFTGKARLIGITGSPGAGKSSLNNKVASLLVEQGFTVGIIAVDPSSPFSGGAILGDRVRMNETATLENVFISSMATRGHWGD
jgi:LAO/AO transport system kinase